MLQKQLASSPASPSTNYKETQKCKSSTMIRTNITVILSLAEANTATGECA